MLSLVFFRGFLTSVISFPFDILVLEGGSNENNLPTSQGRANSTCGIYTGYVVVVSMHVLSIYFLFWGKGPNSFLCFGAIHILVVNKSSHIFFELYTRRSANDKGINDPKV